MSNNRPLHDLLTWLDEARLVRTFPAGDTYVWFGGLTVNVLDGTTGRNVDAFELPFHELTAEERSRRLTP